jgi:hypothetical protein
MNRLTWKKAATDMRILSLELLTATPDELAREAKLREWRIGHAYLRFAGVGSVHGVVNITTDPNDRYNPRPLNPVHVENLSRTFNMVDGKQDRESPIYLKCDESLIHPDCLALMNGDNTRTVSSRDLDFAPPALRLVRPKGELEDKLESETWFKRDAETNDIITEAAVASKQARLTQLQTARKRATLVNGNHRTGGMLAASRVLRQERDAIIAGEAAGEIAPADLKKRLGDLHRLVQMATYRCEVYKGT